MKICPKCGKRLPDQEELCPDDGAGLLILPEGDDSGLVGRVLDRRYRIDGVLGRGGMGVVYRARHLLLERDVAVKVMRRDLAAEVTLIKRFFVEARATSSLDHPNIITLYDFGQTTDGLLYLSMEYLDGVPLHKEIRGRGGLPLSEAFPIAAQIADALCTAHGQGVLHRDLKPENVFLARREGALRVKVLDFGIARLLGDTRLTDSGVLYGTPHYLSPEQATGAEASPSSDLYALGVILYEMITGLPPFHDEKTPIGILTAHATRPPPAPGLVRPGLVVPEPLEQFLERVLAKVAYLRPDDASSFRAELDEVARRVLGSGTVPLAGRLPASGPSPRPAPGETRPYAAEMDTPRGAGPGGDPTLPARGTGLEETLPAPSVAPAVPPAPHGRAPLLAGLAALALLALGGLLWAIGGFRTPGTAPTAPPGPGAQAEDVQAHVPEVHVEEVRAEPEPREPFPDHSPPSLPETLSEPLPDVVETADAMPDAPSSPSVDDLTVPDVVELVSTTGGAETRAEREEPAVPPRRREGEPRPRSENASPSPPPPPSDGTSSVGDPAALVRDPDPSGARDPVAPPPAHDPASLLGDP